MYTGYIVRKDEKAADERVARAIVNLGLSGEDVICLAQDGYVSQIETVRSARLITQNRALTSPQEALEALVAHYEGMQQQAGGAI